MSENHYLNLNRTDVQQNSSAVWGDNNSLDSNIFQIGADTPASMWIPSGTHDCIFYVWTSVEGYSAFGSYTGSGDNDGSFIFTGFAVRWLLIKCTSDAGQEWVIIDSARSPFNVADEALYANDSAAEVVDSTRDVDLLSNGFKLRNGNSGSTDFSGRTYIYAAYAEHPFKSSRAR